MTRDVPGPFLLFIRLKVPMMNDSVSPAGFPTTHWSRVVAAGDVANPGAGEALAELCAAYWFPLYAYIRRKGNGPEQALDLTQGYFTRLLERGTVASADPARGRFRSFLLADCRHFLAHERERAAAALKAGQLAADRALLAELESIRGNRAEHWDRKRTDTEYAAAFRKAGLDLDKTEPAESGKWLAARSEPMELAGYLDDWAFVRRSARREEAAWRRLVAAARAADPDPWRDALRARVGTTDASALAEFRRLADDQKALDAQTAPSLILLAIQLKKGAGDHERAARVLRRAVARHPAEFWAQYELSQVHGASSGQLSELYPRPEESVRHLTAAVAIRPGSPGAHSNLGNALYTQGKIEESVAEFREAIRLKPDFAAARNNLGNVLKDQGKLDLAVAEFREAIRLNPDGDEAHGNLGIALRVHGKLGEAVAEIREAFRLNPGFAAAHTNLGNALKDQGKLDLAVAAHREAIRLKPDFAIAHNNLGIALNDQGKFDEAVAAHRKAIRLKPDFADAHNNLGIALKDQGKLDEAVAADREAIRLKPDLAAAHINLGIALQDQGKRDLAAAEYREAIRLKPDLPLAHYNLGIALNGQGKLNEAVAAHREAIRLRPDYADAHHNLGNALQVQRKLDLAVAEYRVAIRLKPDLALAHVNLGMALRSQGAYAGSLAMLRRGHELGTKQPGWRHPSAQWVAQAERMAALAARLPALLKGEDRPKDVLERLALAQMCYDAKRFAAAARFWAGAMEADPKLGDDRRAGHRYNAACAAALAASGQARDEPPPDDAAKAKLRRQALGWLKAEQAAWGKLLESGPPQGRPAIAQTLNHWKQDNDLAGIREAGALAKLPEAEQKEWRAFWADVEALLKRARPPERPTEELFADPP
ncbi:MAG: tetratricopeptide repeat protein [Isosphaerales bacterium]